MFRLPNLGKHFKLCNEEVKMTCRLYNPNIRKNFQIV